MNADPTLNRGLVKFGVDDIAGFEWPIAFWCNWIAPLPLALRFG